MRFHHAQGVVAQLHDSWQAGAAVVGKLRMNREEPGYRDIGLVAVLLEEHPLQCLCAPVAIIWEKGSAFREIAHDGVGFEQQAAILQLHCRNAAIRELAEERGRAGFALDDINSIRSNGISSWVSSRRTL